ncbi:MAG: hypothetical protein RSC31_04230, partial [Anaerovoracaceae bacterium]
MLFEVKLNEARVESEKLGEKRGEKRGIAIGKAEGKAEIIAKMLGKMSPVEIAGFLEIPEEEVLKIQEEKISYSINK